jgi:hypothetical protein
MAAKVYLVTRGSYSDYRVESVWSTEALANGYIAESASRELEIEEFWLDEPDKTESLPHWVVSLQSVGARATREPRSGRVGGVSLNDEGYGWLYLDAESEEAAIRIASDIRAQHVAQVAIEKGAAAILAEQKLLDVVMPCP